MDIVVKYCGGCNCQIDRSRILTDIQEKLDPGDRLITDPSGAPYAIGLLACGCTSACAWKPEVAALAGKWVTLAGKTLDSREFPEEELAAVAVQRINEIKKGG